MNPLCTLASASVIPSSGSIRRNISDNKHTVVSIFCIKCSIIEGSGRLQNKKKVEPYYVNISGYLSNLWCYN